MKKSILFAAALVASLTINATEIWSGSANSFTIAAANFTSAVAGNQLDVVFTEGTGDKEILFFADGKMLPGTRFNYNPREDNGTMHYDLYMTQALLDIAKVKGIDVVARGVTITKVDLLDGKASYLNNEGDVIWTGYHWMDTWSTLELTKNTIPANMSDYKELVIFLEAGYSNYILNIKPNWVDADNISTATNLAKHDDKAVLDLSTVDINDVITKTGTDRIMFQFNKEDGTPFNITDIVLIKKNNSQTGLNDLQINPEVRKIIRNGQVLILKGDKTYNMLGAEVE